VICSPLAVTITTKSCSSYRTSSHKQIPMSNSRLAKSGSELLTWSARELKNGLGARFGGRLSTS
jgi:hypothetical protein